MRESINRKQWPEFVFARGRLPLGPRVWTAGVFILVNVLAYNFIPIGWFSTVVTSLVWVIVGVLLQPIPRGEDHGLHAKAAVRDLAGVAEALGITMAKLRQLRADSKVGSMQVHFETLDADVTRVQDQVFSSMIQWETVSPGVVELIQDEVRNRRLISAGFQEEVSK